jgi:3-deoxy-7-phosphoheptulonate synthase
MSLENVNVARHEILVTPEQLKARLPAPEAARANVEAARRSVNRIIAHQDHRLLVVVGPCSIHDPLAARDYAQRLAAFAPGVADRLLLVMRAYFEKPRTTTGWKGLINDPFLDDSFRVADGLRIARELLLEFTGLGLPVATEALDPITPQYLHDLISWTAIGARTSESQTHREMASGLSSAVGFKNGTDGSLAVAANAMRSVISPHRFLGINPSGQVAVIETRGNPNAHLVLRGGSGGPNYEAAHIRDCEARLAAAGLPQSIMVDCSHANAGKDPARQPMVARDVVDQIVAGNRSVIGLMLESHLHAGRQDPGVGELRYGVSITDPCIDWETTETLLIEIAATLGDSLARRVAA